jgi:hypothetical protein
MKVLGIGLGRTGTMSLTHALEQLGFSTIHCPGFFLDAEGRIRIDWGDFDSHDAVTDEGAALVYQEADRRYPGAKFILTVRDTESWLRSRRRISDAMQKSWDGNPAVAVLHEALYGAPRFDPQIYAEAHRRHVADVREYFTDRPRDLLVLDVCAGQGWDKLCPFLGKPVPDSPFPRSNVFAEMTLPAAKKTEGIQQDESTTLSEGAAEA